MWGPEYQVVAATLDVHQSTVIGTPYASLGNLLAEGLPYGVALDPSDEAATPIGPVVLSTTTALGAKTADVTAITQALWVNRVATGYRMQYRVRFTAESDLDAGFDFIELPSGESTTNYPTLTVTFEYP
jgi:hypothetical protein